MEQKELAIIVGLVVVIAALGGGLGYVLLTAEPSELQDKSLDIKLWWPIEHYGSTESDIANILKDNIEATGRISVTLDSVDWATYVDQFSNGQMGMFLLGWYPDFFDADNYIQPFLSTGGAESLGSMYSDPLMDLA
ncbi:MAG: ABC transporter substrate-binding protein, partial [Candidatus Thermoplasmatota archaeon]|nr:ABC transporter substrate-binding protein [Candidatus Thermoplasmatota archaeon]